MILVVHGQNEKEMVKLGTHQPNTWHPSYLVYLDIVSILLVLSRLKVGRWCDKRLQLMNDILSGMRVIKMYCWEKPFSELLAQLRK